MKAVVLVAVVLVLAAQPASSIREDDTLSRMYPHYGYRATAGLKWPWYDSASTPNQCNLPESPLTVAQETGATYYPTARVYYNIPAFAVNQVVGPNFTIPVPCPAVINPLCTVDSGCALHLKPLAVSAINGLATVTQDGKVCVQESAFIQCVVTDAKWWVDRCAWYDATFKARDPGSGKGIGHLGLENVAFSQDIDCGANGENYAGLEYNFSRFLGYNNNLLSSGIYGFPLTVVVPYGNGLTDDSSFVVSCLQVTYSTIDESVVPPLVGSATEDGVDWLLALDLDALPSFPDDLLVSWTSALVAHLGTHQGQGQVVEGIYDLGGNNDCDFGWNGVLPQCYNFQDDADVDAQIDENDLNGCWRTTCNFNNVCTDHYAPWDDDEGPL